VSAAGFLSESKEVEGTVGMAPSFYRYRVLSDRQLTNVLYLLAKTARVSSQ